MKDNDKKSIPDFNEIVKEIWTTKFGKVVILVTAGAAGIGLIGGLFKVGTITLHQYKDFRDALRR